MGETNNQTSEKITGSIKLEEKEEINEQKEEINEQKEEINEQKEEINEQKEQIIDKEKDNSKEENEDKKENKIEIKTLEEAKKEEKDIINKKEEQTSTSQEKKNSKIGVVLVIVTMLVIIIAILSTIFAVVNIGNTKIMKGISISNVDVSNMTQDEAKQALNDICSAKSENQIYFKYGNLDASITYEALEVQYKIDEAVNRAYSIGRSKNIFINNINILKTWINEQNIDLDVEIDPDVINQISQNINNNLEDAVVQPSYYIEDDKLIITAGKEGIVVDEGKLEEEIYIILKSGNQEEKTIEIPVIKVIPDEIDLEKIHTEIYKEVKNAYYTTDPFTIYPESNGIDFDIESAKTLLTEEKEEYEIQLIITKPTKTVNEIGTEAFPDKLSTFSTNYMASNVNRTTNLKLAAQKINGTVILPGEEFSYNKIVGERTIQAGYKEAAVYSNGQVVNGLGGGICQISSTLYDAVVMANLEVTERRNHQFVTSYLPAGKDATVVWGSQDFKFKNTRSYPVRIEATVNGGVATITIWGLKEDVEYEISIETKKTATIAYTTQYVQDPSLPVGKEVVKQAGSNGRKVEAYKVVKLNGQVVSTTLLSKDTYNAMKRIVHVGTASQ